MGNTQSNERLGHVRSSTDILEELEKQGKVIIVNLGKPGTREFHDVHDKFYEEELEKKRRRNFEASQKLYEKNLQKQNHPFPSFEVWTGSEDCSCCDDHYQCVNAWK